MDCSKPIHGTSPISLCAPNPGGNPFLLDMATSSIPWNKVLRYRTEGIELPEGVAVDAAGEFVTDPHKAVALAPIGGIDFGYKGAAMAGIVVVQGRGAVATAIKESKAKHALEAWLEHLAAHLVTFKSAGGAAYAVRRSHRLLESYLGYRSQHFAILIRQTVSSFALKAVASSALLGIGGWLVISRQLTLGQLVASELVVAGMLSAFTKFGKQLEVYYDLCAALDKLGGLIDLPLERSGGDADLPGDGPLGVTGDVDEHHAAEPVPSGLLHVAALLPG